MSNSLSNHLCPALLPLPGLPDWQQASSTLKARAWTYSQDIYKIWDNALPFRREVGVDRIDQASAAPQAIAELAQSRTGLFAHELVIVKQRARQAVTALRLLDSGVRLVSWRVNADGSLLRTGSSNLPLTGVQQVKLVHARNYVVACRLQNGEVHLSRWDVSNTGAIYQAGSQPACAQQVQWLEMAALTPDLIVTFGLTAAQSWQLMLWQLQGDSDLRLLQSREIPAAAVTSCDLAVLPPSGDQLRWATVVAESPTTLALQLWQGSADGAVTLLTTHHTPMPGLVAVLFTQRAPQQLQVAVQTVTGQLRLLTWRLAADQQTVVDYQEVPLSVEVSQWRCQPHPDGFALTYRTVSGELHVQRWQSQPDGTLLLVGAGHAPTLPLAEVTCCDAALEGNAPLLTGVIDEQGEVILTTWR